MEFDTYSLVLLRRGPRAFDYSQEEIDRLQAAHLAHLDAMRERGALLPRARSASRRTRRSAASASTGPDWRRRGELAALDGSVQAGRMRVDVVTWLTPRGELAFRLGRRARGGRMSQTATAPAKTPFAYTGEVTISVNVRDMNRAIEWYREAFGFELI